MPKSRRRKPKPPRNQRGIKLVKRGNRVYLRMRDEDGNKVLRELPDIEKKADDE